MLRRARGYSPAPIALPEGFAAAPPVLAMGGELKNTFCLVKNGQAILSQHLGDLEDAATFAEYRRNLALYCMLFDHTPRILAIDRHPRYLSTQLGQEWAARDGLALEEVQHHHAHIVSCIAEYGVALDGPPVLGIALDGLGYGDDGKLWGGEFLIADYLGCIRVGRFKPVAMPGGAQAAREQARLPLAELAAQGDRLVFRTDSYVVDPLFFAGGDIGRLAVAGTVNDLAVGGARPLFLRCAIIAEEGLDIALLRRVARSMQDTFAETGVKIVTCDTKVVPRGAADKLFVNTAGIGVIAAGVSIAADRARPGDAILVNGTIGDHGVAILQERADLGLTAKIASDCQPLNGLIAALLASCPEVHCLRDATRGGVATVLNEFAAVSRLCLRIRETALPIRDEVRGVCELLGLDPLYIANEGKFVAILPVRDADRALAAPRSHPAGRRAAIIGEVAEAPEETVLLITPFGGSRILDMLVGEQLPRIC